MAKQLSELSPDEAALRAGQEPVYEVLRRLGITRPENQAQLDVFNAKMEEIFSLSEAEKKWVPVRYLHSLELLDIKHIDRETLLPIIEFN